MAERVQYEFLGEDEFSFLPASRTANLRMHVRQACAQQWSVWRVTWEYLHRRKLR
jgi:hypothetical protein